jgi:hypothetical protein
MESGLKSISVEVTSMEGCSSADTISISFIECLGINEKHDIADLQVYPNPGNGLFTIELDVEQQAHGKLVVIDNTGRIVYRENDVELTIGGKIELNLQHLAEGIYTVQLTSYESLFMTRIILQR